MSEASISKEQTAAEILNTLSALALVRTAFSSQRSLMAWMRTSVSLYTFGFSIAKFADYLKQQTENTEVSGSPHLLGLLLIIVGILAIVLAVFEHAKRIQRMKQLGLPAKARPYLPIVGALALLAVGITTLIGLTHNWPV